MPFIEHFKTEFAKKQDDFTTILGQSVAKEQIKSALLTNRHILILGPPGVGKTTIAKNVAQLLPQTTDENGKTLNGEDRFIRVQGSPDLTAEDLIGDIDPIKALEFGPLSKEAFSPGKIFKANNGVLFFDEVNRCSEKLQNALLQALEEGIATIGSYDVDMPANFIFIGTLNPQDSSTEKLNDAFLDRFDIIEMDYPETQKIEYKIVKPRSELLGVPFPEETLNHTINYVRQLRNPKKLVKLPSVRATIGLVERAQANAFLRGNAFVEMQDVYDVMKSVLAHRIELKPSLKYAQTPEEFLTEQFSQYAKSEQLPISEQLDEQDFVGDDSDST